MAKRIAVNTLNASTLDIMNVIRENASYDYQQNVPEVTQSVDVPAVGEVIYGTPAFANQFINALINRIAIVRVQSAVFNNPYAALKKGYLEYGETIEDIFVSISKVVDFNVEKAPAREFKRSLPDVRSAFHVMNWRVMYPITIQDEDLKRAFLSADGVQNLITKVIDAVYTAAQYDEFLLFKYLMIKAITNGKMYPISIGDGTNLETAATEFRTATYLLPFMSSEYNEAGVKTTTPPERQIIFMDARFQARYGIEVLASAFNMSESTYLQRRFTIDNWTEFDNERFAQIRESSDGLEEVTAAELALMADVKAVVMDENWFQVYDNLTRFTETAVNSGLYWNYWLHIWKTISHSPFANAQVYVTDTATITTPATITLSVTDKSVAEYATTLTLGQTLPDDTLQPNNVNFVQTEPLTDAGIAVHRFGAYMIPSSQDSTAIQVVATINGDTYTNTETTINSDTSVGTTLVLTKQ